MANNKKKKKKDPAAASDPQGSGYYNENNVQNTAGAGLYDPNATYGRTPTNPNVGTFNDWLANQGINKGNLNKKRKTRLQSQYQQVAGSPEGDFANTDLGEAAIEENPEAYVSWLMGEAGGLSGNVPIYGGPTQFGQFMEDQMAKRMSAYEAANLQSGGQLSFRDYMASQGYGPNANKNALTQSAPTDTGNPFTSSSGGLVSATPASQYRNNGPQNFKDFLKVQGLNKNQMNAGRIDRQRDNFNAFNADTARLQSMTAPDPGLAATPPTAAASGLEADRKAYLSMTPQQRGINSGMGFKPTRWSVF